MTTINIYRSGGEWCWAAFVDGEFDASGSLGLRRGATLDDAYEAAEGLGYASVVAVSRVADTTADGVPL